MQQAEKAGSRYANSPNVIEVLEERRLLQVTLDSSGTLSITETTGDVNIVLTRSSINLDVNVNGTRVDSFPLTNILKIAVVTGNGNDSVIVDPNSRDMFVNMDVRTNGGNDAIITAAGNDTIVGGAGADTIHAGAGDDQIWGDYQTATERELDPNYPYADSIFGEAGFDRVFDVDALDTIDLGSQTSGGGGGITNPTFVNPDFTIIGGEGLDPNLVRQWYDFGALGGAGVLTGAGQTIYLVTPFAAPNLLSDLQTFSKAYGIPFSSSNLSVVSVGGAAASESTWGAVTAAEVEWMHAMAPGAKIVVVQAQSDLGIDVSAAIRKAASLSESRGGGIVYLGFTATKEAVASDIPALIAKAPRTTFLAPTGDTPDTVSYLASLNTVIAVGGSSVVVDDTEARIGETALATSGAARTKIPVSSWQKSLGLTRRVSPDVVYHADPNLPYAFFSSSPVFSAASMSSSAGWSAGSGTVMAGAQWAALFAIVNQGRASRGLAKLGGSAAPALYAVASASSFGALHDITTGTAGTAVAKAGFDTATGLGSPDARLLVKALMAVQPFYISGSFKWEGKFYKPPTSPSLGDFDRDPLIGEPRGGTGTVAGGDRIALNFKAIPNKWAPSNVARTDVIKTDPTGLYRTADGHVYGYGTATIHDEDNFALVNDAPWAVVTFRVRFEGTIRRVDATHERLSLKFFAVTDTTLRPIPESPFARQRLVDLGTASYLGTWFGGSLSATVFSLGSRMPLPAGTSTIAGIVPDIYEGDSGRRDNKAAGASIISTEGTPQRHTMHTQSDVDWVTFVLAEDSHVVIETNGVSGGDTVITLYDEYLTKLASNDDAGIGAYSKININLEAGRYYVKVSQFAKYGSGISDYSITVRAAAEGEPLPPSPIRLSNGSLTITGTEEGDDINLTQSGRDLLITVNGDTYYAPSSAVGRITINALGGDDNIDLSTLSRGVTVNAGDGNDVVNGSAAADRIFGGLGADIINGYGGDDVIFGEDDDDLIVGGTGNDYISGGFGNDAIDGSEGNDTIDGDEGDDTLTGGPGNDSITGGPGIDLMNAKDGELDTVVADSQDPSPVIDDTPGVLVDELV